MMTAQNLDVLYQEIILDHYKNPHGKGLREPHEAEVHHVNPTCGDEVTLRVHLSDGLVEDVSYDALGCSISQASASVLYDLVVGKSVDNAMAVHEEFLTLMQGKGEVEPDEDVLEDAHRLRRRREVPGPREVCSAVVDGLEGRHDPIVGRRGRSATVTRPRRKQP